MVDIDNKDKTNEVKSDIEEKIENAVIINIEDTASYAQYQGEIEEGENIYRGIFRIILIYSFTFQLLQQ